MRLFFTIRPAACANITKICVVLPSCLACAFVYSKKRAVPIILSDRFLCALTPASLSLPQHTCYSGAVSFILAARNPF